MNRVSRKVHTQTWSFDIAKALVILFVFAIFWLKGTISLDPDFGYRLRNGQLILTQGIPKSDPYSYTMPSFPAVEHSWLTATSWALLYPVSGKVGLAALASALAFLALVVSASRAKSTFLPKGKLMNYFASFPFLLAVSVVLPFTGVRVQVVTWLMLAILLRLILDGDTWRKWRLAVPLYFILWANLHGGFASGLATLFLVTLLRSVRLRRLNTGDFVILILSFAATLVNPYGLGAWREVWSSISDTGLRFRIVEWMPAIFMADLSMAALITFSAVLIIRYRRKLPLEEFFLYFAFLLSALASRRHLPLWVLVALPMTIASINLFYQEVRSISQAVFRFQKVYRVAWFGSLGILVMQSFLALRGATFLSEDIFYPKNAVQQLKQNLPEREIFSEYGWGGYLIWKLPEKRVFIDGRMPSWRREEYPPGETGAAFDDYTDLLNGDIEYKLVFEKYKVDTVLWPVPKAPGLFEILQGRLDEFLLRFGKEKKDFNFLEELAKDGWEKTYEDSVAVIYKKPG